MRRYDKCHKNSVQNKQDTLYNKTQVEKSKAASSKEISKPIHTILKTNTYLKSKERKFLSYKNIYYRFNKNSSIALLRINKSYKIYKISMCIINYRIIKQGRKQKSIK